MEIMAKNHIFKIDTINHFFIASLHNYFVVVEALSQMRQIQEAMKRKNVNCGKKSKQAFSAGKEIEAMKRLTLHRVVSSL
jgi:hypothetical protein